MMKLLPTSLATAVIGLSIASTQAAPARVTQNIAPRAASPYVTVVSTTVSGPPLPGRHLAIGDTCRNGVVQPDTCDNDRGDGYDMTCVPFWVNELPSDNNKCVRMNLQNSWCGSLTGGKAEDPHPLAPGYFEGGSAVEWRLCPEDHYVSGKSA